MNLNEIFYHAALRKLGIRTTKEEFAETYANASNEEKNNSIWQSLYEEGKEIFSKNLDVISSDGKIDQEEFSLFEYMINYLKNLPTRYDESLCIPRYKGETDDPLVVGAKGSASEAIVNRPAFGLDQEIQGLKPLETMSREECIAELKLYYPERDFETADRETLIGELLSVRTYLIKNDKNSDIIDYHIGTFTQNQQGNCGVLSQIAQLSDDEVRNLVQEGEDSNGKYYMVTFPMDINNPENTVKIYESEVLSDELIIPGNEFPMGGFCLGDADARLFEMAYARRFGTQSIKDGESPGSAQNIFSYPDTPRVEYTSGEITEEKLLAANEGRATLCVTTWDLENESMSYFDEYTDESGLSAKYAPLHTLESLKNEFKLKFPQVNEDLYKDLNEEEFLEFSLLFVRPEIPTDEDVMNNLPPKERQQYMKKCSLFNPRCKVVLSNGDYFIDGHAYIFKSYNPETKEVTIIEPHTTNTEHVIPLEIAQKFFRIST